SHRFRTRPRRRAAHRRSLKPRRHRVRIRHRSPMLRIVLPCRIRVELAAMKFLEAVAMEEMVVYDDPSADPPESPTPSAPSAAAAEIESEVDPPSPTPAKADPRIVEPRPRI